MKLNHNKTMKTYNPENVVHDNYMVQTYQTIANGFFRISVYFYSEKANTFQEFANAHHDDNSKETQLLKWAGERIDAHIQEQLEKVEG